MKTEINGKVVTVKLMYADLEALPEDGKRYELHEGEVFVSAAPGLEHQDFSSDLYVEMREHVTPKGLGKVYQAIDVYFREDTVYTPDLVFVTTARAHIRTRRFVRGAPDIIVEIVSPSTEARDRGVKFQDYARYGVHEDWIIDPLKRMAEVFVLRDGRYELLGKFGEKHTLRSEVLPELVIPLAKLWPEPLPEN